jgi:hypothetical protein
LVQHPDDKVYDSEEVYNETVKSHLREAITKLKEQMNAEKGAELARMKPILDVLRKSSQFVGYSPQNGGANFRANALLDWNETTQRVSGWIELPELKIKKAWEGQIVFDSQGQPLLEMKDTSVIAVAANSNALVGINYQMRLVNGQLQGPWVYSIYNGSISLNPAN